MNMHLDDAQAFFGEDIVTFGAFQLNRTRRALLKNGSRLAMGSRAMEILLALTEKAGAVLSNRELLRRVWPNIVVEDGTIRVHVALLRKVLREADPESDYVHNVTGRGYRFAAAVSRLRRSVDPIVHTSPPTVLKWPLRQPARSNDLPHLLTPVFGREQTILAVAARVARVRFVTITGPGGIGKTTVAIKAAESLAANRERGVCFIDLASLRRPEEVWSTLAAALGVSTVASDPLAQILANLSKQSMLMVLDNCEHMIEVATRLAESVLRHCPLVNILATSREPLRASGEFTHELAPLELHAVSDGTSREELMSLPAIRLFVERASAHAGAEIGADELPLVANVCRRLAGNPLAIEIAAGQVRWLGMKSLSTGLNDAMYLAIEGRRTAERRHQTLRASFDWSYSLLSRDEQLVFQRLSAFAGNFNQDLAIAAIADERLTRQVVRECLISLTRKSLIVATLTEGDIVYRLNDLPRAYARIQQLA
ncbi:MAG: winged helix-turn-helix domain-containing protein [Steroidobacter sp.]